MLKKFGGIAVNVRHFFIYITFVSFVGKTLHRVTFGVVCEYNSKKLIPSSICVSFRTNSHMICCNVLFFIFTECVYVCSMYVSACMGDRTQARETNFETNVTTSIDRKRCNWTSQVR